MKAIGEIGFYNSLMYLLWSFVELFYNCTFVPPTRKLFLQIMGANIGSNTVTMKVKFINWHHTGLKGMTIGKECFISDDTLIDLYDNVFLEDQVTIAQRVVLLTHVNVGYADHPLQKYFPRTSKKVILKKGCVIGAGSIILPGITVGEKSFVGAGSVVTKNVAPGTLVAGAPARLIRKIQ